MYTTSPSFPRQLFLHLKTRISRKFGSHKNIPWMHQKEIDLLTEALINLGPKKCLEWGAGFSTLYYPSLLSNDIKWSSVEHNEEWYHEITKINSDPRVDIALVKPDQEPFTEKDGGYDDFKTYIEYPSEKYDFILIDGRARKYCVKKAFDLVTDNGLVVLHDANRKHYYEYFDLYKHQVLFDDHHDKYGGIWFASKGKAIEELINVKTHKSAWRKHDILAKILKPF